MQGIRYGNMAYTWRDQNEKGEEELCLDAWLNLKWENAAQMEHNGKESGSSLLLQEGVTQQNYIPLHNAGPASYVKPSSYGSIF